MNKQTGKKRIAVIAGDGIGKEVMPEGIRVLEAAAVKYRTYALTTARNCGVRCSLPGMKPVTKAATTLVNNSVFHW